MAFPLSNLFNEAFLVRTAEQLAVTFVATFVGALTVGSAGLTVSALAGAAAVGVRAVYAVLVKDLSTDGNSPSAAK